MIESRRDAFGVRIDALGPAPRAELLHVLMFGFAVSGPWHPGE